MKKSDRRETVMLCHTLTDISQNYNGWFLSEKMDGLRAFWDGGITRGLYVDDVPWANTDKHGRYKNRLKSTSLWTRYYQPIMAPEWFLDQLPNYPLDGELYVGRGQFQEVMSTCKKLEPDDDEWKKVKYMVFDIPSVSKFLTPGRINMPNFSKEITPEVWSWAQKRIKIGARPSVYLFEDVVDYLQTGKFFEINRPNVDIMFQQKIHHGMEEIRDRLNMVEILEGEGLVIRAPNSFWEPKRSYQILKVKKSLDSEAVVVGYVGGKETDRGSKLLGLMGALVVVWNNKEDHVVEFELSGFTDIEREMVWVEKSYTPTFNYVAQFPGKRLPRKVVTNPMFPIGSKVCFKYSGISDSGIPRFARYYRKVI